MVLRLDETIFPALEKQPETDACYQPPRSNRGVRSCGTRLSAYSTVRLARHLCMLSDAPSENVAMASLLRPDAAGG
jgi:hypothetical protein